MKANLYWLISTHHGTLHEHDNFSYASNQYFLLLELLLLLCKYAGKSLGAIKSQSHTLCRNYFQAGFFVHYLNIIIFS